VALGESIAVNGCCLTVAAKEDDCLVFDLLAQTMRVTALGDLRPGSVVNLERALAAGQRFGGHFLQGHVDTTGVVGTWKSEGADWRLEISWDAACGGLVLSKGSIAIDGISLTAAETRPGWVLCWIIPHTRDMTNLSARACGDRVNLEFDMLGNYVQAVLAAGCKVTE
jgi:riboflavin synthase